MARDVRAQLVPGLYDSLRRVLDNMTPYSPTGTPTMETRTAAVEECARIVRDQLSTIAALPELADLDLRVAAGGREVRYAVTPWVRIYSHDRARSIVNGYQLLYLFAADGTRVYLALCRTVGRPGPRGEVPVVQSGALRGHAAKARQLLAGVEGLPGGPTPRTAIDLSWRRIEGVGGKAKARIRGYEDSTIRAYEYDRERLPTNAELRQDVRRMLFLLLHLYEHPVDPDLLGPSQSEEDLRRELRRVLRRQGQHERLERPGRQADPELNRLTETYAESRAADYFRSLGWSVTRVGSYRPYDLECVGPAGEQLHVEVKGTQTSGQLVDLTPNEVLHNLGRDCDAEHALYVVSSINVADGQCSGGVDECFRRWRIDPEVLMADGYLYPVPRTVEPGSPRGELPGTPS